MVIHNHPQPDSVDPFLARLTSTLESNREPHNEVVEEDPRCIVDSSDGPCSSEISSVEI